MLPIKYQVVGEEDYAFVITIHANGDFSVSSGTYTSDRPRSGRLTPEQEQQLIEAVDELDAPQDLVMPEGAADAFKARLTIGEGSEAVQYPFWEGALESDTRLQKLVRLLEML